MTATSSSRSASRATIASRRCQAVAVWVVALRCVVAMAVIPSSRSSPDTSPASTGRTHPHRVNRGPSGPVAATPGGACPAGARLVSRAPGIAALVLRPDAGRVLAPSDQVGHPAHGQVDMPEEQLVSVAEVVQAGLAVGSADEPVLRASPVAGEAHIAGLAVVGQRVQLRRPERALLRG